MAEIIMPKMGDAMEEGRIVQWLKKVGDAVGLEEPIAEIETDKSNVEVPADVAGTLQSIAFDEGDVVPVGTVIAVIGDGAPAPRATPTPSAPKADAPAPSHTNGSGPSAPAEAPAAVDAPAPVPAALQPVSLPRAAEPAPAPATASEPFRPYDSFIGLLPENLGGTASVIGEPLMPGSSGGGAAGSGERVKASPVARAMAQTNRLDLGSVRGSGPDGSIVKRDVEAAIANGPAPAAAAPAASQAPAAAVGTAAPPPAARAVEGDEVQEYNAMRRTIAKRLAESKSTIPHFYVTSEIDAEAMLRLREEVNAGAAGEQQARKISLNDFLVKSVAVALVAHPVVNSAFSDNKRILRKAVNVGIAVSIDDGLIVPVVRDCQVKGLRAIAQETHPLIEKARTGKLKPEEYTGGTFTISNLGQFDVENFAAIINPGEGAILAVSSIRDVAAVVGGQVVPRKRMKVTLCADHRVMDGVAGAQFLQELKRVIENPLQMLL